MKDAIDEIVEMEKADHPDNADFYTREWAQAKMAHLNTSPEQWLSEVRALKAAVAAIPESSLTENAEWTKHLPPGQMEKYCGPVDGLSYGLMEESRELEKFAADNAKAEELN